MRRQDELLSLYPGRDVSTRKYILAQLEDLTLTSDSDDLYEFLLRELDDPDPRIKNQALFTLGWSLPAFLHKRHGLTAATPGLWTGSYAYGPVPAPLPSREGPAGERARERQRAFAMRLSTLVDPLLALQRYAAPGVRRVAGLAAAHISSRSVQRRLLDRCNQEDSSFETALPFALVQGGREGADPLRRLIEGRQEKVPELLLLTSALPARDAMAMLPELISRTDSARRINLALALPRIGGDGHGPILESLLALKDPWVDILALRAVELLMRPPLFPLVERAYRDSRLGLVKVQALRSAAALGVPEAFILCMEAARQPVAPVQAQALESLVRLGIAPEELEKVALPLRKAAAVRTRVNAILATAGPQEESFPKELEEMLLSPAPLNRLEVAFSLGYIQNRKGLAYLRTLLEFDASTPVRVQAVKSLVKYPIHVALPSLVKAFRSAEPDLARTIARVMGQFRRKEAVVAVDVLIGEIERITSPLHRGLLFTTVGALTGRTPGDLVLRAMDQGLSQPDPLVRLGVIRGITRLGGGAQETLLPRLRKVLPELGLDLAGPLHLARVLGGDLDALEALGRLLSSKDAAESSPLVESALDLAVLAIHDPSSRYPSLGKALDAQGARREFQEYQDAGDFLTPNLSRSLPPAVYPRVGQTAGEFKIQRSEQIQRDRAVSSPAAERPPTPQEPALPAASVADTPGETGTGPGTVLPLETAAPTVKSLATYLQEPPIQEASGRFRVELNRETYVVEENISATVPDATRAGAPSPVRRWLPAALVLALLILGGAVWMMAAH